MPMNSILLTRGQWKRERMNESFSTVGCFFVFLFMFVCYIFDRDDVHRERERHMIVWR